MVSFKSALYCFRLVVLADNQLFAASVADTLLLRGLEICVERCAAVEANSSTAHALLDLLIGYIYFNYLVDGNAHSVERFSLRNSSGKAVENEAVLCVGLFYSILEYSDNDVVGNKVACVHSSFSFQTVFGTGFNGCSEHIARRDSGYAELFADNFCLSALAGAGSA